jgi:ferric-dicitrate binding protein FerR (iron transport regulator)
MSEQRWADVIYSEAVGEKLSPEDEAFKQSELGADPTRRAEVDALGELSNALAGASSGPDDAAFARQSVKRANDRRRATQIAWKGAGLLAAAASIALAVRLRTTSTASQVATNAQSTTATQSGCMQVSSTAAACFDSGTKLDGATRPGQLYMSRGHVVAALKPLPPGTEFSITTPHGTATVVGTQFAVDVSPDGTRTEVRVIKGKVRVKNLRNGTEALVEKGHYAILGAELETGGLGEPTPDRDRSLLMLARQGAGVADEVDEAADDTARSAREEGPAVDAPPNHHGEKPVGTPVAQPASAADLLEEARRLRAGAQYESSAEAYRRLVQRYPESAEARAATVSLGQLELSQLGHPDAALHWFDRYLVSGGQLRQEAAYGKIQALQRLGKSAQERREITRFLQDFPKSAQASALRARLDTLGSEH